MDLRLRPCPRSRRSRESIADGLQIFHLLLHALALGARSELRALFVPAFASGANVRAVLAGPSAVSAADLFHSSPPPSTSSHVSRSAIAARTQPPLPTAMRRATSRGTVQCTR